MSVVDSSPPAWSHYERRHVPYLGPREEQQGQLQLVSNLSDIFEERPRKTDPRSCFCQTRCPDVTKSKLGECKAEVTLDDIKLEMLFKQYPDL